jgi:hypothetical protein
MLVTPAQAAVRHAGVAALALAAAVTLGAREAHADFFTTAKLLKTELVQAYAPCDPGSADTMTGTGFSACLAPTVNDMGCRFTAKGRGKVKLLVVPGDVLAFGVAKNIDVNCEGLQLALVVSMRITADNCPPGAIPGQRCTTVDLQDYVLGTCNVQKGRCDIKTSFNRNQTIVANNNRTLVETFGCSFRRMNGLGAPVRTFTCGINVP